MPESQSVRCRVAACREELDDAMEWSFYLLNDGGAALDHVVLYEVGYEWGGAANSETVDRRVTNLAPGDHALIWRDDGSGAELRMDLWLRVRVRGREARLLFEFPKLYRKSDLPLVEGLGKPGWVETVEATTTSLDPGEGRPGAAPDEPTLS